MKNEAYKVARRRKKYGLSRDDYSGMLTRQSGRCIICGEHYGEELRVDHDHATGEVRGLLCSNCNAGLGFFKENPDRLKSAIEYVTRA